MIDAGAPHVVHRAGSVLGPLRKGPYGSAHLVKWCAAQQNWDRIHYDAAYARDVAGLPERVINGALKQHLLVQLLDDAFGDTMRLRRLCFRFVGPDFVGDSLEVHGTVRSVESVGNATLLVVDLAIRNATQSKATTTGWAALSSAPDIPLPESLHMDDAVHATSGTAPPALEALVGSRFETAVSATPLDASRLFLFADAVGGLRDRYFRPADGSTAVAPPLFPIHALQPEPGSLPLSLDPEALGREGVNEMGRNFGRRFGVPDKGLTNGGSDVEVFSLLGTGETVRATSTMLGVAVKPGASGIPMLLTTVLNDYSTTGGRRLMREKQTTIYRNFEPVRSVIVPADRRSSQEESQP